eukprot:CAMPEP_0117007332 /NCGR_PEP_ID=MMETSP0472-20121206/7247_1 /TAXON_ID=693140 ORGANISM="Tiarina fusus, Strain LIS" /NCGR_SAMPLE_ID=MMETSP0472 /ASSEMBLY_ACC=CAM_ASM_000603 /LENGTH=187 /DNA_ID=CAMNT_0004709065 /DNA_START=13 /DNA_END=572 /DNA_ORIENTATION=-
MSASSLLTSSGASSSLNNWATTGFLVVTAAAVWAYQSSDQKRIESHLKRQGIPSAFEWSLPFIGHIAQFFHPERLELEMFDRPDIPRLEYLTLFGTPMLIVADADLTTDFWNKGKNWAKSPIFYQLLDVLFSTKERTLITAPRVEDPVWHGKREIVGHSFRKENMSNLANFIEEKTIQMCDDWCERG